MGETTEMSAGLIQDVIRALFSAIDRPVYMLLGFTYKLFFNVASADIFTNDTIMKFYSRIQLILGVFMMFQLAMVIIRGIINPDSFTDSKTGIGNVIMRICVALFLLTALVPINIPSPRNEYEKQINNNGLLFGTLYSLQYRILANNTIGRLILGTDSTSTDYVSTSGDSEEVLDTAANIFTSTILKGFYRINLLPKEERNEIPECANSTSPETINACRMCQEGIDEYIDAYKQLDADPNTIIDLVNETCDFDWGLLSFIPGYDYIAGNQRYIFTYSPIISTIVGIVFIFILFSFTIDVAVRLVKLAILRLLAPIPIISYMDPKGSKDGAFNAWVKTLTSTYLDLFMRLAIVYFVIFLIQEMIVHGIVVNYGSGFLGILTLIIIWIGLFVFAKQAPKFIKQVLGIKDSDFKLFGGMGAIVATAGTIGSTRNAYRAAREENAELHPGENNLFRNVGAALLGGISGAAAGYGAAGDKDANIGKVLQAQAAANSRRSSHSTLPGRIEDSLYAMTHGRSLADRDQLVLDANNKAFDEMKKYKTVSEEEALKQKNEYGSYNGRSFNYNRLQAALQAARGSGSDTFDYSDGTHTYTGLSIADFDENVMNDIKSDQAANYVNHQLSRVGYNAATGTYDAANYSRNGTLWNQYEAANRAAVDAELNIAGLNAAGVTVAGFDGQYKNNKQNMGRAKDEATRLSTSMETIMHRANKQNKK